MDECPAPTPEINLPRMALAPPRPPVCPPSFQARGQERDDRARVPKTGFHGTGQTKDPLKGTRRLLAATALRRAHRMMLQNPPRPLGAGGAGRWRGASHLGSRGSRPVGTVRAETTEGTVCAAHPGSGAYRSPAAPGSRLLLPLSTERGERERKSERGSCSNPIPGAAAAAAASATAGEVT